MSQDVGPSVTGSMGGRGSLKGILSPAQRDRTRAKGVEMVAPHRGIALPDRGWKRARGE